MNPDFTTVLWKEWKEILLERSSGGGGFRPLIMVGVIGIVMPLQLGAQRYFGPPALVGLTFVCLAGILAVVADAFAGERERHTLETLLASRLPDQAILLGKMAACLGYGLLLSIITIAVGIITVNAANWNGHVLFYRDAASWLCLFLAPPLLGGAVASAGVLVSLRAATVRQAQQTLTYAMLVVFLTLTFGTNAVPINVRLWFTRILVAWSAVDVVLAASAVVLTLDLLLVLSALSRFQRSKLILD